MAEKEKSLSRLLLISVREKLKLNLVSTSGSTRARDSSAWLSCSQDVLDGGKTEEEVVGLGEFGHLHDLAHLLPLGVVRPAQQDHLLLVLLFREGQIQLFFYPLNGLKRQEMQIKCFPL